MTHLSHRSITNTQIFTTIFIGIPQFVWGQALHWLGLPMTVLRIRMLRNFVFTLLNDDEMSDNTFRQPTHRRKLTGAAHG